MIRRGGYKYIHQDVDALLLFNIAEDPAELTNLADDPDHAALAQAFAEEAARIARPFGQTLPNKCQRRAENKVMQSGKRVD